LTCSFAVECETAPNLTKVFKILTNTRRKKVGRTLSEHNCVALDLGAESGRVILGTLSDDRLVTEEIHRFANLPITIGESLRWNILGIFGELKKCLRRISEQGRHVESISADSWGFDYVHFTETEPMLSLPYHYRDSRTDGAVEKVFATVPAEVIFSETGTQFSQFNTLCQLIDDVKRRPIIIQSSEHILNIADYINYLFSGVCRSEASLASTTQLFNPRKYSWSQELIRQFGIPERIFSRIVPPGTKLGPLLPACAEEVALKDVEVTAGCSHDTAAAVAAVPAEGRDWAYVSSGTWSLFGVEIHEPIINRDAQEHNFTNEVGYGGTIRFLKNLVGLWIIQECRREWSRLGQDFSYDQLTQQAENTAPLQSLINPVDQRFSKPYAMPQKIVNYCRETQQKPLQTPGEIVRCALESLALLYRKTLDEVNLILGWRPTSLHIVGGGGKNHLLNQLSANATQLPVLAGPPEATAIGNILVQAIAMGHLDSVQDMRRIVRNSFPVTEYQPEDKSVWNEAYDRFQRLPAGN
jgi:rhamnulokinase